MKRSTLSKFSSACKCTLPLGTRSSDALILSILEWAEGPYTSCHQPSSPLLPPDESFVAWGNEMLEGSALAKRFDEDAIPEKFSLDALRGQNAAANER